MNLSVQLGAPKLEYTGEIERDVYDMADLNRVKCVHTDSCSASVSSLIPRPLCLLPRGMGMRLKCVHADIRLYNSSAVDPHSFLQLLVQDY